MDDGCILTHKEVGRLISIGICWQGVGDIGRRLRAYFSLNVGILAMNVAKHMLLDL